MSNNKAVIFFVPNEGTPDRLNCNNTKVDVVLGDNDGEYTINFDLENFGSNVLGIKIPISGHEDLFSQEKPWTQLLLDWLDTRKNDINTITPLTSLGVLDFKVETKGGDYYICVGTEVEKIENPIILKEVVLFKNVSSGNLTDTFTYMTTQGLEIHRHSRTDEDDVYKIPFVYPLSDIQRVGIYSGRIKGETLIDRNLSYSSEAKALVPEKIGQFEYYKSRDEKVYLYLCKHPVSKLIRGFRSTIDSKTLSPYLSAYLNRRLANVIFDFSTGEDGNDTKYKVIRLVSFYEEVKKLLESFRKIQNMSDDHFASEQYNHDIHPSMIIG